MNCRLLVAALILQFIVGCGGVDSWPAERFDEKSWMTAPAEKRFVFVRDIIDKKLLIGRSREQVIALLGRPSSDVVESHYLTYLVKNGFVEISLMDVRFEVIDNQYQVKDVFVRTP